MKTINLTLISCFWNIFVLISEKRTVEGKRVVRRNRSGRKLTFKVFKISKLILHVHVLMWSLNLFDIAFFHFDPCKVEQNTPSCMLNLRLTNKVLEIRW